MFSLIHKATFGRSLVSHASHGRPLIIIVRRGYAETAAVSSERRKPSKRIRELAQDLMERGAPKIEGDIARLSQSELVAWVNKIKQETDIDMPPTKTQLMLAQYMVEEGAPNADKLREGMTWRELSVWVDEAKNLGWKPPIYDPPLEVEQRHEPATAGELAYAREIAAYAGLEVPYDAEAAKRGEVADFIARARDELILQNKEPRGPAVPSGPATMGQKARLKKLGAELSPGLTWGEAYERLQKFHPNKGYKNKSSGSLASAKKETAKEVLEPEMVEESAEGGAAELNVGQESDKGPAV
ncbi:hypothetical protein CALCODRAFT_489849 [Calocera cornea HHB12733]|uniref:Uncharacterized protein n=1 Tax=Calocera cornea HHB12733 TaxID=1353952 RepID=A0A165JZT7_9BASI|nr:hypothetical protein CALCODRAFT_489849 [Calocera cornea HHB12733]